MLRHDTRFFQLIIPALVAAFGTFVLAEVGPTDGNFLTNGGFEEMSGAIPRGWMVPPHLADRGSAGVDTANRHGGLQSLLLTPNRRNKAEGFAVFQALDPGKLQGKQITVSGYAAVEDTGNSPPAAILFKAGGENWIPVSKETGGKFVPFSKTFSVPKDAPDASLLLFVGGTNGRVWFDDLSVTVSGSDSADAGHRPSAPTNVVVNPVWTEEKQDRICTTGWQDSVCISPDGRELYFAYIPFAEKDLTDIFLGKIKPENVKLRGPDRPGNHGPLHFETYVSKQSSNGSWGPPQNLNINSNYHLYAAKLSFDGKELYYAIRGYRKNYGGDDIYFSRRQNDGSWSPPENLGPNINTKDREDHPFLSADGATLYFVRNKGEALGWEIYSSRKVNGTWSRAEKLPPPINQSNPEKSANQMPFITADGKEFYFNRIMNIHRSKLKADGTWGTPEPVFPQLAASGHASVTADGRRLYFQTAADKASLERHHWTFWVADRQKDGSWGNLRPVD